MKMLRTGRCVVAGLCLLLGAARADAQTGTPPPSIPTAINAAKSGKTPPAFRPGWAVGIGTGTQALGFIDAAYGFHPHFTARLGYNHLALRLADREFDASAYGVTDNALLYTVDARLSTVQLGIDYTPGAKLRWLRLSAGAHVAVNKEVIGQVGLRDPMQLNDVELTPEELGGMEVTYANESSLMPYAALGFGPSLPWKRFAVNADLGAIYRGTPTLTTVGSGLLSDNEQLGQDLVDAFGGMMQVHPIVSLRVAYRVSP